MRKILQRKLPALMALLMVLTMLPTFTLNVKASVYDYDFDDAGNRIGTCGAYGDGSNLTWKCTEDGVLTISGNGPMKDYDDYVADSGKEAPWLCFHDEIKEIVVETGVTSIGTCAFEFCEDATSIVIPEGITTIGGNAFYECENASNLTIPDSVTSIGFQAYYKSGIRKVTISKNVTYIGEWAFFACEGLTGISVDAANSKYSDGNGCNVLIEKSTKTLLKGCDNSTIPNTVKVIGEGAFAYCNIKSIKIPNSVITIGNEAFCGCFKLKKVSIGKRVKTIGPHAFSDCQRLSNVVIPKSVKKIDTGAFDYCMSLKSINIPDSVTYIGDYAFWKCHSLKSITIQKGVTYIGTEAFENDGKLSKITLNGNTLKTVGKNAFKGVKKNCKITVQAKNKKRYNKIVKLIKKSKAKNVKYIFKKKK